MLLRAQENELIQIISAKGLSTNRIEREKKYGYKINYSDNTQVYSFSIDENAFYGYEISFTPGIYGDYTSRDRYIKWKSVLKNFSWWLDRVIEETSTPDLWAEAAKTAQLFAGTTEAPDDKFTRTELAEVQGQLRQLQQSFEASTLPETAQQKLIELTQTAAVKAEGLTKKDWQNWIIGGFISAITSLALNPTQAGEVLKLVKAAFGGLFLH